MLSGGEGKQGTVQEIRGWDNESGHSVAHVTWASGVTNVYRLGHKGKVDLKYVEEASGGSYYPEHLPILGETSQPFWTGQSYPCKPGWFAIQLPLSKPL